MSLHRVASIESWERPRGVSPAASERRKMSFNPVAELLPPKPPPKLASTTEPLVPIEVSATMRIAQVAIACIYCLLAAGVVFGYAAIKPVLIQEGVYRQYCPADASQSEDDVCYEQEIRLNLMFTVAAVATNMCALPVGTILDRYGPRVCSVIGAFLLALGAVLLAIAPDVDVDTYISGYLFLALGGPFVFIASFQLSNCFPQYSGLILAMLTGAFDTSSAVFLVYRLLYEATEGWLTPQRFFMLYLAVPLLILLVQITVMPGISYRTVGELVEAAEDPSTIKIPPNRASDERSCEQWIQEQTKLRRESVLSEITPLLQEHSSTEEDKTVLQDRAKREEQQKKKISGVWGALHGRSAREQICTPWFLLMTAFVVVQMTRINYFVATVRSQYEFLLQNPAAARRVNHVFDIALPAGGVISIPFIGLVLDRLSTATCIALLVSCATLIGIFGLLPSEAAAYANIAIFVLYRPFYYTAVSDYAAKVFGFDTFGKVYGLIICVAGLGNFSQSALDALTHRVFANNPLPVNLALLVLVLALGLALVVYVYRQSRIIRRDWQDDPQDAEPGSNDRSEIPPT